MAHADDLAALDALDLAPSSVQRLSAAILNRCVLDWRNRLDQRADVVRFLRSGWGVAVCAQIGTDPDYIERRLRSYG
jgi:hypothetical protein